MDWNMYLISGISTLAGYCVGAYVTYSIFRKRAMKKNLWFSLMKDDDLSGE